MKKNAKKIDVVLAAPAIPAPRASEGPRQLKVKTSVKAGAPKSCSGHAS